MSINTFDLHIKYVKIWAILARCIEYPIIMIYTIHSNVSFGVPLVKGNKMNTQFNKYVVSLIGLLISVFLMGCMPAVQAQAQAPMEDTCIGKNADGSLFMVMFEGERPEGQFVECYRSDPQHPRYILFQRSVNQPQGVSPVGDTPLASLQKLISDGTASMLR